MKKLLYTLAASLIFFSACKKADFADNTPTGEGLVDFTLLTPASGTKLALNAAIPNALVNFSWNPAKPGLITNPTYKVIAALRTGGDLANPLIELDGGSGTSFNITQKLLDDALKAKGIADGVSTDFIWSVKATNGSVTIQSTSVFFITITRMKDGASPFLLLGPTSSLGQTTINPTSTSEFIKFNWTKSRPATGGPAITYRVLFAERKLDVNGNELPVDWSAPLFSMASDNNGADSLLTVSYKRLSDSLIAKGFTNLPSPVMLKWTVRATSGTWNQLADYVNNIVIVREVKVYIVGSASPGGWDISQSTRMIEDPRFPGTYFSYLRLTGGNEIKFVNGQAWPPAPGAVDWGQDPALPPGNITDVNESNIPVSTTGIYRVTFDLTNKKYYLQTAVSNGIGGMGMIGAFQGWSQPAVKMGYAGVNRFIYIASMNTNDEFKFHDGNDWNNSANNLHRWFAVDGADKMVVDPGSGFNNFKWTGAPGRMRSIWDGSNPLDLKYSLSPASEMRVVGNGMQGVPDWNPGASPQMTYAGNGTWTLTLILVAGKEIKFLAGNNWGAFDYEDNSGGSTAVGTPRGIKWDGNDNFKTPIVTGSYTITLNEHTQTVTFN